MYDWTPGGFGIYLHWPFCQSKCPYCDFNSHVSAGEDASRWRGAFLSEIGRYGRETEGRLVQSIYFGGGTPSLMDPTLVDEIIASIRRTWPTVNDLEITLEANPGSVEAGRFRAYREAGVNRVSLGVQALNDDALRLLGRMHTAREALTALDVARSTFDRTSFDLIYARQFQTFDAWTEELAAALQFATDHLSLYQLTVEDGTVFSQRAMLGKLPGLPSDDLGADMFELTQEMTMAAGLPAYEISNHARPGFESRHNLIYWRGGDYVGIGPGAHGRITGRTGRVATECQRLPSLWLQQVDLEANAEVERNLLTPEEAGLEYLLMALRTSEGLDLQRYVAITGKPLSDRPIQNLVELGMVEAVAGRLRTTPKGQPLLNAILRELCVEDALASR